MSQGLQVWDAGGNLILDINDQVSQTLGSVAVAARSSGSIVVPRTGGENQIFYFFSPSRSIDYTTIVPTIWVTGDTLSWSFDTQVEQNGPFGGAIGGSIQYGRY
jgi:hypothetical protein